MSMTGLDVFDRTLQKSHEWLDDIRYELDFSERKQAYRALRSTLHGLRDCLTSEDAAHRGAQLPMLIRGLYYEGWNPALRLNLFFAQVMPVLIGLGDGKETRPGRFFISRRIAICPVG